MPCHSLTIRLVAAKVLLRYSQTQMLAFPSLQSRPQISKPPTPEICIRHVIMDTRSLFKIQGKK